MEHSFTEAIFFFQTRQLLIKSTLQIKRRKISRCKETFSYQNDMIQNKINDLVSIAIFLLYNKMLSSRKNAKMILEVKFQDKAKSKWWMKMILGRHYCYKGNLFWNMLNVMWAISKRYAIEATTPSWF